MNLYDISVEDTNNKEIKLDKYQGKVLLIVNTATKCGFTKQYDGLQKLYEKYRDQGFEILDFPCNQFLMQAPGSNQKLAEFCSINFGTTFQTFAKINVNGKNEHPLYHYLKNSNPSNIKSHLESSPLSGKIKWNFTKFLIDREGNTVGRYDSSVTPESLDETLSHVLNSK
ncbi:glutathione peroxidase [Haploplasma axanthum]|uniref:Glutathione peroxidase n=1 Tax=Haploplasma axanthum TaxID=29552 RepID=A0A449BFR5_HAPAX|nr:glutathione peroxidase [Haploplasma axanthum]VEU81294.1 Glutathione peroxidase homolog BsaA [Haploplasma axanthum]